MEVEIRVERACLSLFRLTVLRPDHSLVRCLEVGLKFLTPRRHRACNVRTCLVLGQHYLHNMVLCPRRCLYRRIRTHRVHHPEAETLKREMGRIDGSTSCLFSQSRVFFSTLHRHYCAGGHIPDLMPSAVSLSFMKLYASPLSCPPSLPCIVILIELLIVPIVQSNHPVGLTQFAL